MDQYASTLNTYAQVLWLKMEYFNDTATQLVEFLDDQVFTKFNNESLVIQVLITLTATYINPIMQNLPKGSATLKKSCSKCYKIFKACLTILGC